MTGTAEAPDLTSLSVLVVEDEFYLAMDLQEEIERAGGRVVGPVGDVVAGKRALADGGIDCAMIDINLGTGPSFELADALREAEVPFLFLTGYDSAVVPDRFEDIERLLKPAPAAATLHAIARIRPG